MTDKSKKENGGNRIDERKRFHYIGFEVFPGEPKDLFKSDNEKKSYVEKVQKRRESNEILREDCTLLEERVSVMDRVILSLAAIVVVASLFVPWFAAYNEIVEEAKVTTPTPTATAPDSLAIMNAAGDTAIAMMDDSIAAASGAATQAAVGAADTTATAPAATAGVSRVSGSEEIIHGYTGHKKKVHKEYDRISGIGIFGAFGSVVAGVFSSGFVLILSGILMLGYLLLCIALPAYTLYGIYGIKGDADTKALALKKIIKLNWIPVIIFFLVLFLSFFGADYGIDAASYFTSLGDSYGVDTLLGLLSWGIIITLGGFVLLAAKGAEI